MSFSFGGIVLGADLADQGAALFERLGVGPKWDAGEIKLVDATRRDFVGAAVGSYRGRTVVIDPFLPYDCSHMPGELTALDDRLAALSVGGAVLCFVVEGTSDSYQFSYYAGGQRVRCRRAEGGRVVAEEGALLPAEAGLAADADEATRIFAISGAMLGTRLDEMIFRAGLRMRRYS